MSRRRAQERYDDLKLPVEWPPRGEALATTLKALMHPRRRALLDLITARGPAPVGRLARWTGWAAGSVSHHVRVLAEGGFVEPAPDLAGDTRESWWRSVPRTLSWGTRDFEEGTAGAELVRVAAASDTAYLLDAIRRWQATRAEDTWLGSVSSAYVLATQEELTELGLRLSEVVTRWDAECRAAERREDRPRRAVRAVTMIFPEGPHD